MNLENFLWHNNANKFDKNDHAMFGASNYHWINYSIEKMINISSNLEAKKIGTELHELAAMLIKNKIKLPEEEHTLNMYVNDAILLNMRPEEQLYYSKIFYGTADAICIDDGILRIHDLKTGKTKPSIHQLEIYAAFYLLEYRLIPIDFKDIELRIYWNNEIWIENPGTEILAPIMDKIVTVDDMILKIRNNGG